MEVTPQTSNLTSSKNGNRAPQSGRSNMLGMRVRGIMGGLALQFLLGLSLATFADYSSGDSSGQKTLHNIFLGAHELVGLGLLVGATIILVAGARLAGGVRTLTVVGFAATVLAFIFGVLTINVSPHSLFSFLMGTMFLIAFATYGMLAGRLTFGVHNQ